jgi:hypothetical protein
LCLMLGLMGFARPSIAVSGGGVDVRSMYKSDFCVLWMANHGDRSWVHKALNMICPRSGLC